MIKHTTETRFESFKRWCGTKALPWLAKNWQWILLPIGILLAISKLKGRPPEVVTSELVGAGETIVKANAEATKGVEAAQEVKNAEVQAIKEQHSEAVKRLSDEQKSKVTELESNPQELNSFLKGIGKSVGGK